MPLYTLTPQDVLFFRDGRPMEASSGHGARWPEPSLIFDALHAALHRAFPDTNRQDWEHRHDFGRSSHRPYKGDNSQRFGSLQTAGLFPVMENGEWLLPVPQDVVPSDDQNLHLLLPLKDKHGHSNLSSPLKYPLANPCDPSKDEAKPWWTKAAFDAYLDDKNPADAAMKTHGDIFVGEWTTGIGIDPVSQTQDGERIYSAEYLRLRPGVRLGFSASLSMKQNGSRESVQECIDQLLTRDRTIVVGGQQRVCSVEPEHSRSLRELLPVSVCTDGTRVKWVLLTPAIFPAIAANSAKGIIAHPGGWLPNWIDPATGKVELRDGPGSEKAKRLNVAAGKPIAARLVAARIPKPIIITGWSERIHRISAGERNVDDSDLKAGAKPTHLAVPAGAVYYFEAEANHELGTTAEKEAQKLAAALNWHGDTPGTQIKNRRSTLMGEKGFGLGVCGTWKFYEEGGAD